MFTRMCCLVERTQIAYIDIYDLWNFLDEIQIMRAFALIAVLVGYPFILFVEQPLYGTF